MLQHEAPDTVSSFLQRMGRTGRRAGQVANTTFFCETGAGVVQAIALVELAKAGVGRACRAQRSLLIGSKAERRFGRRRFMELYAVFSSPQSYSVETTAGQPLGTLGRDSSIVWSRG